ncbi:MAG: ribosomal protein S18-alanine N-acetyltransferase [Halohasta sp.]
MAPSPPVDAEAITVRRATRPDLSSIHRLEKRVFDEPWSYGVFEEFLGEPAFLVAELDGRLFGYVVADWTANNGRDFGHIKDLAVDPEAQRNGIGRLLLRQAVSRLLVEGVVRIKLEVREHNTVARRLYVQEGFEPRKRIPRYYHDGEAALVLVYEPRR